MSKPEWRDPEKEQRWRKLLRLWRRSGLSGRDFCTEHGLQEGSFYAWRREIARRDQEETIAPKRAARSLAKRHAVRRKLPAFMQVKIEGATSGTSAMEVIVANGRMLRVRPGFDGEALRQLLRLVEERAC
jgi:transposase